MELQVEGRNLEIRKSWQEKIDEEQKRLDKHHPGLVHSLRITLEETPHHKEGGFQVGVVAVIPSDTVVVKRKGDKIRQLMVEAFDTLGLRLKEFQRKKRQSTKLVEGEHSNSMTGVIKSLFPHESYGFIVSRNGREIYFHENAFKEGNLDLLAEGDEVCFGEGEGYKGPTANWVKMVK